MGWVTALLFALSCNLDTVLLSARRSLRGKPVPLRGAAVLSIGTTAITWLSLALGRGAAHLSPEGAERLGGLLMCLLGAFAVWEALRGGQGVPREPERGGWLGLAGVLAGNNALAGLAAGAAGISPLPASLCNLGVTLGALALGRVLGLRLRGRGALALSGGLLFLLGLWEMTR